MVHTKTRIPHIDMAFEDLSHVEGEFQGLVGQFYGKGVDLEEEDGGRRAMMRVGLVKFLTIVT